jgi:hypothetical protein
LIWRPWEEIEELDRFGDPEPTAPIVALWRQLPTPPAVNWTTLAAQWSFGLGSPAEGLVADLARFPGETARVDLPHRILPADTPFWYRARVRFDGPTVLRISADDAAHLWVDDVRIIGDDDTFILPEATRETTLTVRVLNKAMFGGLQQVWHTARGAYLPASAAIEHRARLDEAILLLRRLVNPSGTILAAARRAVAAPITEANVAALEKAVRIEAALEIEPVVHPKGDGMVLGWQAAGAQPGQVTVRTRAGERTLRPTVTDGYARADMQNLTPGETVEYQISGHRARRFRALPDRPPFRFTIFGDPHIGGTRFRQIANAMRLDNPAFTVGIGDHVVGARRLSRWQEFFRIGSGLFGEVPTFLVGGNHDYGGWFEDLVSPYHDRLARAGGRPWFSFRVAGCAFLALDPNVQFPTGIDGGSEQHRWLLAELERESVRQARTRVVLIHQPPYFQGWTGYEGDLPIRALLDPLIERHRIHLVISGHTHDYERLTRPYGTHSCTFLILGGAGGGLEDGPLSPQPVMDRVERRHHYGRFTVGPDEITFEAVDADTTVFDRYVLKRP